MERPNGAGSPGTACNMTHHLGYVITLEPARTPSALAPACHIRAPKWTPRTSAASKYAPFVFIKRKYTSEDEESGDEDAPGHVPAAAATPGLSKALLSEVPAAAEVGGGRREQVTSPPPLVTYQRRMARHRPRFEARHRPRFEARHRPRFKSLESILQETAPGYKKDQFNQAGRYPSIAGGLFQDHGHPN